MSLTAPPDRPRPPRVPLSRRKLAERHAARARIEARVARPLSAEQRAFDPLVRGSLGLGSKLAIAAAALLLSSGVHAGVYGFGSLFEGGEKKDRKRDIVAVEVREKKREPAEEKPKPKEPEPERVVKPPPPPKKRAVEPPPEKAPPEKPGKPVRVVGLTLDSTSQGGSGPSFAVGNTRQGETDKRATDPKKMAKVPPPLSPNQTASRIPTAGAKYVLPRRKRPIKPPYPVELLAQGIEAAVTVMVSLDTSGNVKNVKIIKSSGRAEFDESARKTALAEQFEPATRDGTPIPYTLSYTYRFTIDNP